MSAKDKPIEGEVMPTATEPVEPDDAIAILIVGKNPMGRPTDMTIATVTKLLTAFNNDYNVTQACGYAGIATQTYYRWCKENSYFSDKMAEAKEAPNRKAKEVVIQAIAAGDANLGFRWLERRDPDYKPKAEVDNNVALGETREKIKEFLDDDSADDVSEQPPATDSTEARGEVADAPTDIS